MSANQNRSRFLEVIGRYSTVAAMVFFIQTPSAEGQTTTITDQSTQDEIRRFCTNIADAARDQRYLLQKQELEKLQADVDSRIETLENRRDEYEDWLARRNHFLEQAKGNLVSIYKTMKPDAAAPQLQEMHAEIAAAIIMQLPPRQSGSILAEMDADKAAYVAGLMSKAVDPNTSKDPT
jgi:flagellar motility protein MotE (MotC chaperone)